MNQYAEPRFADRPCENCERLETENRRMLTAIEAMNRIATDMLDPVKRRGPSGKEMRRTAERRHADKLEVRQSGASGSCDVANAEEEL